MNRRIDSHFFWGIHSPLSALTGVGLIIMASSRFAFAIVCACTLIWVYGGSTLIFCVAQPIMPSRGKKVILLFLTSFLCAFITLFIGFLNPLLILSTIFFIILIPPFCLSTGLFEAIGASDPFDVLSRALFEAVTLAGLILALALIREPLGMATLSIPGNAQGIRELFNSEESNTIIPAQIFSVSSGGLLLLGYGTALYRYIREQITEAAKNREEEE